MSACYSSGLCGVDVQSRFKMDNIWQYLKCGCVFLVLPLFVCLTGLSEGTHTSNPPSQPEDSTAWDSFQVSGGRIHLLLELWWSSDHLSDAHNFLWNSCSFIICTTIFLTPFHRLLQSSDSIDADIPAAPSLLLSPDPPTHSQPLSSGSTPGNSALDELDLLGKTLLQQSLPPEGLQVKWYLILLLQRTQF